jgi:hypothetical protein
MFNLNLWKMRKSSLFLVVTLVSVMFAGCVKEHAGNVDGDGDAYEKGTVSFALPATGKKVTYTRADAVTGEEDLDNLVIYQFDASEDLEMVYARGITIAGAGTITITGSDNTNRVAKINLGASATGKKTFYLVANVNGAGQVASSALASVAVGTTTINSFESALVTDDLTGTDAVLSLATPLPMSNTATGTARGIVVNNVATPGYQEVTLKRCVARFDIVNHSDFTNLTVTGVIVKKGNLSGEILDKAPSTASKDDGEKVLAGANGNPALVAADYVNPANPALGLKPSGLEKSLNAAQFYLYPTTVKTGETEIFLEGTFKGAARVYPLTLTDPVAGVEIEANYVYRIVVNRSDDDEFRFALLKVAPWNDYTIESGVSDELEIGDLLDQTNASLGAGYDFSNASTTEELHVEVKSTSAVPPVVTLDAIDRGDGVTTPAPLIASTIAVALEAPVLTRALGAVYYTHVVKITLPATQPSFPARARLTISNPDFSQSKTYTLSTVGRYNGLDLKPVLVAGIYWAPVNVGATELATSYSASNTTQMNTARVGYYFQWGRNVPFENTHDPANSQPGPVSAAVAAGTTNFITTDADPYDWLDIQNDYLWSGANAQGPCPPGWCVPTIADLTTAFSNITEPGQPNYIDNQITTNRILVVPGDVPGTSLYMPAAGNLTRDSGGRYRFGTQAAFRSRDCDGIYARQMVMSADVTSAFGRGSRAQATPIRCVLAGVQ